MRHLIIVLSITTAVSVAHGADDAPEFDEAYWVEAQGLAAGKMRRGAGLTVLGLASAVPAIILVDRAADNPHKYLAWSAVMGAATIGMTGHGIGSLGFGKQQREQAQRFIDRYRADPPTVEAQAEWAAYLHDRRKSTTKVIVFGSLLVLQGAALLANGSVLSARAQRHQGIGGATIWPSFVAGGLLFAGGAAVITVNALRLRDLDAASARQVSIAPRYQREPAERGHALSVALTLAF